MMQRMYNPKLNGDIKEKKISKLGNIMVSILMIVSLIFCSLAFITSKTYYTAIVEGASMYPTINASQKTTNINDIAYYTKTKSPKKGEIIIVDYSSAGEDIDAIKRLIATGGDTVCYYNNQILINGEALNETYLENDYTMLKNNSSLLTNSGFASADQWKERGYLKSKSNFENWCSILLSNILTEQQKDEKLRDTTFFKNYSTDYAESVKYSETLETYVLTVPEGYIYFLGDNRSNSTDSSIIGPLETKYMLAKVSFITSGNSTIWSNFVNQVKYLFA